MEFSQRKVKGDFSQRKVIVIYKGLERQHKVSLSIAEKVERNKIHTTLNIVTTSDVERFP